MSTLEVGLTQEVDWFASWIKIVVTRAQKAEAPRTWEEFQELLDTIVERKPVATVFESVHGVHLDALHHEADVVGFPILVEVCKN